MPDPWYDGRGHNYTIIDAPRIGTALEFDEILRIVCEKSNKTLKGKNEK